MNLFHALYPYALAAVNTAVGWLSYTVLNVEFGLLFICIGLLVFLAVVSRTALRITHVAQFTPETVERQFPRR
jgi:hypothetical protein